MGVLAVRKGRLALSQHSGYRLNQLLFGDFNGDGKTDVFTQKGDRWYVSYGATTPFEQLPAGSNIPMRATGSATSTATARRTSSAPTARAGTTRAAAPPHGSRSPRRATRSDHLRFCDFNGDGKTDVFSLANGQWSVSYGGASGWQRLNSKLSSDLGELAFGDFNGDGRCDIARAYHNSWQISYGGTAPWHYESPNRNPETSHRR